MSSNIYLCSRIRSVIGDRLSRAAQSFMRRHDSGSASPPIRTKRPSPYRLLRSDSFLPAFAPLKDAGWALDTMKSRDSSNGSGEEEFADLQDRRLKRVYGFDAGKRGWRDTLEFVAKVGDVVEVEDVSSGQIWFAQCAADTDGVASSDNLYRPSNGLRILLT